MSTTHEGIENVVLVHGAFADGSGWRAVYDKLTSRTSGHDRPDPAHLARGRHRGDRQILDMQDGPTILVGHSWGGTVITEAGVHPNVAGLVYVSALAPDAGETTARQYEGFAPTPDFVIDVGEDGFGFLNAEKFKVGLRSGPQRCGCGIPARLAGAHQHVGLRNPGEECRLAQQAQLGGHRDGGQRLRPRDAAAHGHAHGREDHRSPASHALYVSQAGAISDVIATAAQNALVSVG